MTGKYVYVLSVAASATRIGYVFWIDGEPQVWNLSRAASRSPEAAYQHVRDWIDYFRPDLLITERPNSNTRKGARTQQLLDAVGKSAQDENIDWWYVDRLQPFENKYAEAEALAERFPALKDELPNKRRLWAEEPRRMIVFEALAINAKSLVCYSSNPELPCWTSRMQSASRRK